MLVLIPLSFFLPDLIYYTISLDSTEHSFVLVFALMDSLSAIGQNIEIRRYFSQWSL